MLRQPLPDPRSDEEREVSERYGFHCERCGCSANLTIAIPDAPEWERPPLPGRRPRRDPFAPRRPRARAQLLAALAACPSCGHRPRGLVLAHVAASLVRASFGLGLGTLLFVIAVAMDGELSMSDVVLTAFGLLICGYAVRIAAQDFGLLGRRSDMRWTELFAPTRR